MIKNRQLRLLAIPGGVILIIIIILVVYQLEGGIRVKVTNTGTATLKSIVLHVTGRSYPVGDIAPGGSVKTKVSPTSESHLEIEFMDTAGGLHRLDAGGYFEAGYRGIIRISIQDGEIVSNEQDIQLYPR